jgi:LmbE family N-acetylglucosaminyl deacetylase
MYCTLLILPMHSGAEHLAALTARARRLTDEDLLAWGTTLVVAPHPDDESLGAGGTLARLRAAGVPAHVLFVSDGTQSHPHSVAYPAERLRDLREAEARAALGILGLPETAATFLRLPDTRVPWPDEDAFGPAVARIRTLLAALGATTVLLPWRRDPHRDHRATWHLLQAARVSPAARYLEYPVWLWELGTPDDFPRDGEVGLAGVDVAAFTEARRRAIAAHRSQVTRLIEDDPTAFYLAPELLRYFEGPVELFFEPI